MSRDHFPPSFSPKLSFPSRDARVDKPSPTHQLRSGRRREKLEERDPTLTVYKFGDRPPRILVEVLNEMGFHPHVSTGLLSSDEEEDEVKADPFAVPAGISLNQDETFPEPSPRKFGFNKSKLKSQLFQAPDWTLCWKNARFRPSDYENVLKFQKLNHFPKSGCITRKDFLVRALNRLQAVHGSPFNYFPRSFLLPSEYVKFVTEYSSSLKRNELENRDREVWICKPADSSRGRNIILIRDLTDLQYESSSVVSRYISRPHLINGFKWDLRVYVLVTSVHPLKAYVYQEGLVRFGTSRYNPLSLDDVYSHLTNSSINKDSPFLTEDGCKWTFKMLKDHFLKTRTDDRHLWPRILLLISLTLLVLPPAVPPLRGSSSCFELFGFDILVDKEMKPWLLEVNCSPALSVDEKVDQLVKRALLKDTLTLVTSPLISENIYRGKKSPLSAPLGNFSVLFPCNEEAEALSSDFSEKSYSNELKKNLGKSQSSFEFSSLNSSGKKLVALYRDLEAIIKQSLEGEGGRRGEEQGGEPSFRSGVPSQLLFDVEPFKHFCKLATSKEGEKKGRNLRKKEAKK